MEKDEKQDEKITAIEIEIAKIKERQAAKVSLADCEASKGKREVRTINAINDLDTRLTEKLESTKRELIEEIRNISPLTPRQKAIMVGGGSIGGMTLGAAILFIIKYWPWK